MRRHYLDWLYVLRERTCHFTKKNNLKLSQKQFKTASTTSFSTTYYKIKTFIHLQVKSKYLKGI